MNTKTVLYIFLGATILFFLLLGVYKLTNTNSPAFYPDIAMIKPNDHLKWSPEKKNILVEYSDFQCPACKNFHSFLSSFEASASPDFQITKKVTFVYRHFPLPQHANAMTAAYAAEAAGKQGKFFAMADRLFDTQTEWENQSDAKDFFLKLAGELKLNIDKFKKDIEADDIKQKVNDDLASGNAANVNATPTFFLNGKKLEVRSLAEFKDLLKNL